MKTKLSALCRVDEDKAVHCVGLMTTRLSALCRVRVDEDKAECIV